MTAQSQTVTILPQFRQEAEAKLSKLAKRAARYGAVIAWTVSTSIDKVERVRPDGRIERANVDRCHFEITGEAPRCGDYRFLAQLERTPGGVIISGGEVGKVGRKWDGRCEHCGHERARTWGYVVEDAKGRRKVVGKSCLRDHLGTDVPAGALNVFKYLRELGEDEELGAWGRSRWEDSTVAVVTAARVAIALYGWTPASSEGRRTSDDVALMLSPRAPKDWERERAAALREELKTRLKHYEKLADKVIAWGRKLKPRGDYEHNLAVALAADTVSGKRWGLVVSAAAAFDRQVAREVEEKAKAANAPTSYHFGEIGKCATATVEVLRIVNLPDNGFGPSQIYVMREERGAILSWKTSVFPRLGNRQPIEQGAKLKASFTPKAHTAFRDSPETRVARCSLEAVA